MAARRFELVEGSAKKFWEITVSGSSHTVRYGRIGTSGQTKTKSHASAKAARAAADKLIASKVAKGYAEASASNKRQRTAPKPKTPKPKPPQTTTSAKRAGAAPDLTVAYPRGGLIAVFRRARDLWIVGLERTPNTLDDQGLADLVDDDGFVERWRFASDKQSAAALKALRAEKRPAKAAPAYVALDAAAQKALSKRLGKAELPRIARFAVARSGPVTLRRHAVPDWVFPRPPSRCGCGRVLVPTFELAGPLAPALGKKSLVVVSFCPGGLSARYCEGSIEVVVQTPGDTKPKAEAYFLGRDKTFHVVARGLHHDPIGGGHRWLVTEHTGDKGVPGLLATTPYRTKKDADAAFKKAVAAASYLPAAKPKAFSKWYRDLLAEMHAYHRAAAAKPLALALKPSIAPMKVAGSSYAWSRDLFAETDTIGGQPAYTQSEWDRVVACPSCKADMLFVFQAGSGAPWWSDIINDGDAGSFQFFACPECRGPFGAALFESH